MPAKRVSVSNPAELPPAEVLKDKGTFALEPAKDQKLTPQERRAIRLIRQKKVAEMMLDRKPERQIAEELGISVSRVRRDRADLMREWEREHRGSTAMLQTRELVSLAADERAIRRRIAGLDPDDHRNFTRLYPLALQVIDRRVKLLGLDAPQQIDISVQGRFEKAEVLATLSDLSDPKTIDRIGQVMDSIYRHRELDAAANRPALDLPPVPEGPPALSGPSGLIDPPANPEPPAQT